MDSSEKIIDDLSESNTETIDSSNQNIEVNKDELISSIQSLSQILFKSVGSLEQNTDINNNDLTSLTNLSQSLSKSVDSLKQTTNDNDFNSFSQSLSNFNSFSQSLSNFNSFSQSLSDVLSKSTSIFRTKKDFIDENSNSESNVLEHKIFDSLDDEIDINTEENKEISTNTNTDTNNFTANMMSFIKSVQQNRLKLIFTAYANLSNVDNLKPDQNNSDITLNLRSNATEICAMLETTTDEEVMKMPEFRQHLTMFYKYFNLLSIDMCERKIAECQEIIEKIESDQENLDINNIIEQIAPKIN
jgi:hypothetical protein